MKKCHLQMVQWLTYIRLADKQCKVHLSHFQVNNPQERAIWWLQDYVIVDGTHKNILSHKPVVGVEYKRLEHDWTLNTVKGIKIFLLLYYTYIEINVTHYNRTFYLIVGDMYFAIIITAYMYVMWRMRIKWEHIFLPIR